VADFNLLLHKRRRRGFDACSSNADVFRSQSVPSKDAVLEVVQA
jgi:hypothetical protein